MKRLGMLGVLALAIALTQVSAQDPASLEITPHAGAWLVCAASFSGPDSGPKARELALELRQRHRLNAWIFDRGSDERKKQDDEIRRRRELVPGARVKKIRIEDQHAVLVGGYRDMDSARKGLDELKKIVPADKFCVLGERVTPTMSDKGEDGHLIQQIRYSPFRNAFVVHNPKVPMEKPKESAQDLDTVLKEINIPLLKKLNAYEPYSLLRNPKGWTLVVATFQSPSENVGSPTGNPLVKSFNKLFGKEDDKRSASAENAQKFAQALRDLRDDKKRPLNLDTYVLHTSYYSLVTIGGFESDSDPNLRYLQTMIQKMQIVGGQPSILAQPMPMPVPR